MQQQAQFGVSLSGGGAADGGAEGEEEQEEAAEAQGGEHLQHLSARSSAGLLGLSRERAALIKPCWRHPDGRRG